MNSICMASMLDYFKFAGSVAAIVLIFLVVTTTLYNSPTGFAAASDTGSCKNSCGGQSISENSKCFCDKECYSRNNCCEDIRKFCP